MSAQKNPKELLEGMTVKLSGRSIFLGLFPMAEVPEASPAGVLGIAHRVALEQLRGVEAKRVKLEADEKLSPKGRAEALREHVREVTLPELARLRAKLLEPQAAVLRKHLAELTPAEPVEDVVTELRHQELRAVLRAMEPMRRTDTLLAGPPELRRAVLLADPLASGVAPPIYDSVRRQAIEERHGGEKLEQLTELAGAADAVHQALTVARGAALDVAGIRSSEASEVEAEAKA